MPFHQRIYLFLLLVPTLFAAGCTSTPEAAIAVPSSPAAETAPITIGYSDWPGWTCWAIADQMGFFRKHGVNVKLVWFSNYTDSLNAFATGQLDANCQTWSDSMEPLAQGQSLEAVLVNDNSSGNDALVARPGVSSVKALRGKRVGTELGTCDHFLLLKALEANGMTEADIQFTNIKVQDCTAAMLAGKIDATVVWEPNRSELLHAMKGAHVVFDSTRTPGLIPDLLVMQSRVVSKRPADVQKIVDAWYDMMDWWRAHPEEAVKIMAKRTNSPTDFYRGFIKGTRLFSAQEATAALTRSGDITSLYTSGAQIAKFLVKADQVSRVPDYSHVIDKQFTQAAMQKGFGKMPPYDYKVRVASRP